MHSPAIADNLEAALQRAVSRFDDGAATGVQMRHHMRWVAANDPGARVRARLVLAAAAEEGGSDADAIDAACAIEMVHQFSLIHEEIEEGVETRGGGGSTVWSQFGLAHGINAGDALCAVAYLALLDGLTPRAPDATVAMTRVLHDAQLAMCGGHGRAIAFDHETRVSLTAYVAMMDGKTAALYGAACELGALAAGADAQRARAYAKLGAAYGRALHVARDVQRVRDGAGVQPLGWTYPAVWAAAHTPAAARELDAAALEALGAQAAARRVVDDGVSDADTSADARDIDRTRRVRALLRQALALGPS